MTDHEDRSTKLLQLIEEPAFGRFVQVIRRFVEHHGLGLLVEHAHEVDPSALATGERTEVFEQEVLLEAEAVGEARDFGLGLVTAALAELLLRAT